MYNEDKAVILITVTALLIGELIYMTRAWDKEQSESPTGIEPMTSSEHRREGGGGGGGRSIH